jgi:hypothetical protein
MKTTDMTPRQFATAQKAHGEYMRMVREGYTYDVLSRAWVKRDTKLAIDGAA